MLHMGKMDFGDIAWNFLIGGDGAVYIGRGWDVQGPYAVGYDKWDTLTIAFIGTYVENEPSEQQISAAHGLIKLGVELGKISKKYVLNAQSAMSSKALYKVVKKWPHFKEY